jgi:hypothetical protein
LCAILRDIEEAASERVSGTVLATECEPVKERPNFTVLGVGKIFQDHVLVGELGVGAIVNSGSGVKSTGSGTWRALPDLVANLDFSRDEAVGGKLDVGDEIGLFEVYEDVIHAGQHYRGRSEVLRDIFGGWTSTSWSTGSSITFAACLEFSAI